jgi:hypothetical protein
VSGGVDNWAAHRETIMENYNVYLLIFFVIMVGVVLVVVLVWKKNHKIRSKTKIGPLGFKLDADPEPRRAIITARNIKEGSQITNEGAGSPAEIQVQEDIIGSTITNTAGNAKKN